MADSLIVTVTVIGQGRSRTAQLNCQWVAKAHCQHVFDLRFPRLGVVEAHFLPAKEK